LYLPVQFEESRTDVLHALMRAHPLAALITLDVSGIVANHVPVETVSAPEPHGLLRGHIARANALWRQYRADTAALAIFQGPQVYISPSLYPSKRESGKVVPTWDYAVVHAHGTLRFIHDTAWLRGLVTRLTDAHEGSRGTPWKIDDAPAGYVDGLLGAIVGFEFSILRLTGKWKVSQNRGAADREGVIAGLRAAEDADSLDIADMLAARRLIAKP
jgi:transcriptional regulator